MKKQTLSIPLGLFLALGLAASARATLVTVNSAETWDGVSNPHASDGVTLTGTGTTGDPAIYTIPNGMLITSAGKISLHGASDSDIKFVIEGGNLQMDAGAILNIERYAVRTGRRDFVLDLSVTNSITGAGQIGPISNVDSCPRALTIQNVKNVSFADIDVQTRNVNTGASDSRDMSITASGAVVVSGIIDNSDQDSGGDGGWGVTVKANTIDVNNIDTRGLRNDPSGRAPYSGNVLLQALSPIGNYDPNDSVNNASTNRLTVRGSIRTYGVDSRTSQGNVTLQSVVLQLVFGVIEIPPGASKTLQVGVVRGGASATGLFVDVSGSGQPVTYGVQWGGAFTPPPGNPPVFTVKPVIRPDATQGVAYAQTLAGSATGGDGGPLTFTKFSGPTWLTITPSGVLSGTPTLVNACTNTFQISVTDGTRFDTATLSIFVVAGPRWNDNNDDFFYPDAVQNTPYAGTLATNVIYCGSQALTYVKSNGPVWLNVAADGTLSGTPDTTNVLENAWTVCVTDGTETNDAILRIWVNGSPKFPASPVTMVNARIGVDYSVGLPTLAGTAVDPQGLPITFAKVGSSGPGLDWLTVDASGTLFGTPAAPNFGTNFWTITASNGSYPATTNTLRIVVLSGVVTGSVEVVSREYWDGLANPHASDGVALTGDGSAGDPATYTVPRGLSLSGNGQIYTSQPTGSGSESGGTALQIKFNIQGHLTMASNNNAFVTAVHARDTGPGQRNLILDFNGTNSIVGQGRIVGLGNRVDAIIFPDCSDNDTPRILTITNVNNVSMYDINVQVRNANNWGRPLTIVANGKVAITSGIDNSDRDGGGDGGNDVSVIAKEIQVNGIDTRSFRTASFRNVGNITLKALAPPAYSPTDGVNNSPANTIEAEGNLRCSTPQTNTTWGTISSQSVILKLGPAAQLNGDINKLTLNVGKIQNGAVAGDLFRNQSAVTFTANYVVDWSGTIVPASPTILFGAAAPGKIVLTWSDNRFVLQQNASLSNPGGWVTAPSGSSNPATNTIGSGILFYRLKWPQ